MAAHIINQKMQLVYAGMRVVNYIFYFVAYVFPLSTGNPKAGDS
ncbi:hypothetical protein [Spirosoma migulaei]